MTKIDINTVIIGADKKIWIVHPGKNRKFFSDFEQNSRIYLEYPGLDLTQKDLEDDATLRQKIRRSLEYIQFGALSRPNGTPILLRDQIGEASSNVAVYLRTIKHLFENMQVGDLVVIPGYGAYSNVLFGEITGPVNFNTKARLGPHYFVDTQYRNVRWLSKDRKKQDLPASLIKYLGKPPAIAEVERDELTERFFDYAYDSYVKQNESWSTFTAPAYKGDDPAAISDATRLIQFAVSAFLAIDGNSDISALTFDQIIDQYYDNTQIEYFSTSFMSPGRLDFKAKNPRMGIFIASVLALGIAGSLAGCGASGVDVTNSKTHADTVSPTLKQQLDLFTSSISTPTASRVDSLAQKSKDQVGLKTVVKVVP